MQSALRTDSPAQKPANPRAKVRPMRVVFRRDKTPFEAGVWASFPMVLRAPWGSVAHDGMGVEGVVCAHAGAYHPITRNGEKDGMDMVHHPF